MKSLRLDQIGTYDYPIRISSLVYLNCPTRFLLYMLAQDEVGKAAQTGTLAHAAIEAWAKGGSEDAGKEAAEKAQRRFQEQGKVEGDLKAALRYFARYIADPRNAPLGVEPEDPSIGTLVACEQTCVAKLDPVPWDTTGQPIYLAGTADQIREQRGTRFLWDAKTSNVTRYGPPALVARYLIQLVAYAHATDSLVGGLILLQSYGARDEANQGVFFEPAMHDDLIRHTIDGVRERIAALRMGGISPNPGEHCTTCWVAANTADCSAHLTLLENQSNG